MKKNFNKLTIMIDCIEKIINSRKIVVLLFLLIGNIFYTIGQDSLVVKGVVLSDNRMPFPNVSVSIAGSLQLPVVTNEKGEFILKTKSGDEWLVVSPPGEYKSKKVFLNQRSELKIFVSSEDLLTGDDVFTILNTEVSRRNIVAASSEIHINNIRNQNPVTIDQYMSGLLPGAQVTSSSGMPGSPAIINLRGVRSVNTSNQPLILIDGMPLVNQGIFKSELSGYSYNQLSSLNILDVSKITVVKDPVISAAYGSNGSNGVIMIETLDPQTTETSVDVDFRTGVSLNQSKLISQLNANQHNTLVKEILTSSGTPEEDIETNYPSLFYTKADKKYIDYLYNTNWQKLIFNKSSFSNVNVAIKGGDEIARYGLSFGYITDKGIIKSTGFQGYNLRFVSRVNILKWLKMNTSVSLNYGSSDLKEAATVQQTSPILTSLSKSPMLGPFQHDLSGNLTTMLSEVDDLGVSNPLATIQNFSAENHNYGFSAVNDFEIIANKDLTIKSKLGLTYNILKENIYLPNHGMEHYYDNEAINVSKASNNDITSFYNNTYVSYRKTIAKDQIFTSNTGVNLEINKFQYDMGLSKNAPDNDKFRTLGKGLPIYFENGGLNDDWNWVSFYENAFYSFKDVLLFSGSLCLDMSSRLGANADNTVKIGSVPFGLFYSGGVAWRLSNMFNLKNIGWLEDFKVRASYGKSGNGDLGSLTGKNYYNNIRYNSVVGLYPAVLSNDRITFENVYQLNGGVDLSMFANRLVFNVDLYKSKTTNLLMYSPVDKMLGYDYQADNSGEMENKGFEFNTFVRVFAEKSFKWDVSFNISTIKNQITKMKNNEAVVTDLQGCQVVNKVGAPANSFYGYVYEGVFSNSIEAANANLVNNRGYAFKAGDAKFLNLNNTDNVINDNDKTNIGSPLPKFFGGFSSALTYKHWTLSALLQFVSGNKIFNYVRYMNESMSDLRNQSVAVLNRWQNENQVTNVPRAFYNDPMGNSAFSTRWIEDGSFLRVKDITLSYRLPEKFLGFKNGECYISALNMFTIAKYLGYDPEFAYSFSQNQQGIDYGLSPQPRQFLIGIKIGL